MREHMWAARSSFEYVDAVLTGKSTLFHYLLGGCALSSCKDIKAEISNSFQAVAPTVHSC